MRVWSKCPQQSTCAGPLLDQLIGAGEQSGRDCDPQRLRGLEVEHQFKVRRLFYRQIRWFGSPSDAIDIFCGVAVHSRDARAVGQQTTHLNPLAESEHGRHTVPQGKLGHASTVAEKNWGRHNYEAAAMVCWGLNERLFVVVWLLAQLDAGQPYPQLGAGVPCSLPLVG